MSRLRGEPVRLKYDQRAARLLSAPSWWQITIAIGPWLTIWFPLSSITPYHRDELTLGVAAGLCLFALAAGLLLLKVFERLRALREYELSQSQRKMSGRSWPVLALICAMDFAALMSLNNGIADVRFRMIFLLNRPFMDRLAQRTLAAGAGQPDQQVGLFSATWIDHWPDGMSFRVAGPDGSRFFYSPSGKPPAYLPWAEPIDRHWFWYRGS